MFGSSHPFTPSSSKDLQYEVASLKENYSVFYHKRGIQTLYLGTNGCIKNDEVIKRLKEVLVETLVKEMY